MSRRNLLILLVVLVGAVIAYSQIVLPSKCGPLPTKIKQIVDEGGIIDGAMRRDVWVCEHAKTLHLWTKNADARWRKKQAEGV